MVLVCGSFTCSSSRSVVLVWRLFTDAVCVVQAVRVENTLAHPVKPPLYTDEEIETQREVIDPRSNSCIKAEPGCKPGVLASGRFQLSITV